MSQDTHLSDKDNPHTVHFTPSLGTSIFENSPLQHFPASQPSAPTQNSLFHFSKPLNPDPPIIHQTENEPNCYRAGLFSPFPRTISNFKPIKKSPNICHSPHLYSYFLPNIDAVELFENVGNQNGSVVINSESMGTENEVVDPPLRPYYARSGLDYYRTREIISEFDAKWTNADNPSRPDHHPVSSVDLFFLARLTEIDEHEDMLPGSLTSWEKAQAVEAWESEFATPRKNLPITVDFEDEGIHQSSTDLNSIYS